MLINPVRFRIFPVTSIVREQKYVFVYSQLLASILFCLLPLSLGDSDKVGADVVLLVAHKAACQTLSKAFLKSMKTW